MHRVRIALLALGLTVCLAAPGTRADDSQPAVWNGRDSLKEVKAAVEAYFDADETARAETRTLLDALGALRERDVKTWRKRILKAWRKSRPKLERKSGETFEHLGLKGIVHTAGKPKKNGALFVALHGGGEGNGDGKNALQKWSLVQSKAFVLAPTAPELRGSAWNQPDIEQWVLALIAAAVRTFGLDANKVYVAGHSMGGYGTWSIGCRHADRFAALGACAGGLFTLGRTTPIRVAPGLVPNLLNTPIWFYNSTDDQQVRPGSSQAANRELLRLQEAGYPYEWIYDEYDAIGHGLPPKGLKPIVDWMIAKERDPYPERVVFEPSRPHKRRLFWLGSDVDRRVEGTREGNAFTIDAPQGVKVTVYWNAEMVRVAKPVVIRLRDEVVHEAAVPARLSVLLDSIAVGQDPEQIYDRAVTVP